MNRPVSALALALVGAGVVGVSQAHAQHGTAHERGHTAGAGPHTAVQHFNVLDDGGTIALQSREDIAEEVGHIREHLLQLALVLGNAESDAPARSHLACIPGASAMAARNDAITFVFRELPRGGEVRIITQDAQALQAIHEFLAYARDHHGAAAGHGDRQHQAGAQHGGMQHGGAQHGGMQHGGAQHGGAQHGATHHGGAQHGGAQHGGTQHTCPPVGGTHDGGM
jgi:hypothetical protein